jgi:hypothetical protein
LAPRPRRNRRRARTCRAAQLVFLYLVSSFFPAFRNSSNSLSRKCSIGRARRFTQTKTEQKYAASGLFFRLRVSILIGVKIWDYSIEFLIAERAGNDVGYKCSIRVRYERHVQNSCVNQIGVFIRKSLWLKESI